MLAKLLLIVVSLDTETSEDKFGLFLRKSIFRIITETRNLESNSWKDAVFANMINHFLNAPDLYIAYYLLTTRFD